MLPYVPLALSIVSGSSLAGALYSIRPRLRYTRNGGMRFLRIARLQMSWCVCRNSI